jgi:hypothetical protein
MKLKNQGTIEKKTEREVGNAGKDIKSEKTMERKQHCG